jgi:hypothetical protein
MSILPTPFRNGRSMPLNTLGLENHALILKITQQNVAVKNTGIGLNFQTFCF